MSLWDLVSPDEANTDVDANGNPTHTRNGVPMSGATAGSGHQGAARGSPRAGVAPNQSNYMLGGSPDFYGQQQSRVDAYGNQAIYAGNVANSQAQGVAQQADQTGDYFNKKNQGISRQAQSFGQTAGQLGLQQNSAFQGQASQAQGRTAPTTGYDPALAAQQQQSVAAGNGQLGLAAQLSALANAPEGPSAAQAQLQAGTNQALAAQLALARSGRGLGENASMLSRAGEQASGVIANQANASAALRAQENQAYRQNQLNALNASGQQLAAARAGNLGLAQQFAQQGQFDTQSQLQQQQMNDAYASQLAQLGLQAQGQGYQAQSQGIAQQLAAQGQAAQAQNQSIEQQLAAQQVGNQAVQLAQQQRFGYQGLGLGAAQSQQQGLSNYENELSNIYGMDIGAQVQNRQLNQQNSVNWTNAVLGGISALGSWFGSDRRMKHRVRDANLDDVFRALDGEGGASRSPRPRARVTQLSDRYAALAD